MKKIAKKTKKLHYTMIFMNIFDHHIFSENNVTYFGSKLTFSVLFSTGGSGVVECDALVEAFSNIHCFGIKIIPLPNVKNDVDQRYLSRSSKGFSHVPAITSIIKRQ